MIFFAMLSAQAEQYEPHNSANWLILIQWILPILIVASYILLAVCIWRAAKYFGSAGKEQKLLRMEMGKLAEELHLMRQEFKGGKNGDAST